MLRDAILAVGLVFSTFSQLRFFNSPIGPGELCLLAWLGLTLCSSASRIDAPLSKASLRLITFWAIFLSGLSVGMMNAYVVGERNVQSLLIHDLLAYALVASTSLVAAFQHRAASRLRRTAWLAVIFGSSCFFVLIAQTVSLLPTFGLKLWYFDRLMGWSTNPNQLALQCLILTLLAAHLAETANSRPPVALACLLVLPPLLTGFLTKSDGFVLGIVFTVLGSIGWKIWRMLRVAHSGGDLRGPTALLAAATSLALLIATGPLAYTLIAENAASSRSAAGVESNFSHDVDDRTTLWAKALDRSIDSGFLGLGPGPHLRRPTDLRQPQDHVLPDFEAHNTFADLALQGGFLAVLALIWIGATAFMTAQSANLMFLPLLLLSLIGFSLPHFIFRHPIIWFILTLCLVGGHMVGVRPLHARR